MTDSNPLQAEYSGKIESNGALEFIGSNNRNNFDEHSQTHSQN